MGACKGREAERAKRSAPACGVAGRVSFKREAGPHSHLLDITLSFRHRARLSDAGKAREVLEAQNDESARWGAFGKGVSLPPEQHSARQASDGTVGRWGKSPLPVVERGDLTRSSGQDTYEVSR